jgi:S-(hydroxymethyl)glutathione dehydrogenase/alcohol dehydrogenase
MRASAAVLYEVNKPLVVEDVEVLEPKPHEVLVRVMANGVCHSDLHVITGDLPHPLPVVLGHEAAEKVGAGVESIKTGNHVCSIYIPSCGRCSYCINGTHARARMFAAHCPLQQQTCDAVSCRC